MNCYRVPIRSSAGASLSLVISAEDEAGAIERAETLGQDLFRRSRPAWMMEEGRARPRRGDPEPVYVAVLTPKYLHPSSGQHVSDY